MGVLMKNKSIILLLSITIITFSLKAQEDIDSLKNLLGSEIEDTIRIDALSSLSWKLKYTETDQAMKYAEEALELAEEGGHLKATARVHQYIASISRISNQYDKSIKHAEASIKIASEIEDYIRVSNSNNSLGLAYRAKGDAEKAIHFYKNASASAIKAKSFGLLTAIQNNTGDAFLALSEYDSARVYYFNIINRILPLKDSLNIQQTFNAIGISYMEQGDYSAAFKYYFKALAINEQLNNLRGLEYNWNNLGNLYHSIEDYEKALFYHEKTLSRREETNNKKGIANTQNNIGLCFLATGDYIKASQCFKKSIAIHEEINTKANYGTPLNNMGLTMKKQGLYVEAESYFNRALKAYQFTKESRGIAITYEHLAGSAFYQKQYQKAINLSIKSLEIAEDVGALEVEKDNYNWLAKSWAALNNPKESSKYFKAYSEASEQLLNENKAKIIAQSIAKYELNKKETIIENQTQKISTLKETTAYERLKGNLFLGLAGLLFLLILFVTFYLKQKNKFLKKKTELELNLVNLNNKMISQKLKNNEQELRNYVQLINEKNEVLETLQKKINAAKNNQSPISSKVYQELNQSIQSKLNKERDWDQFQKQFHQIHGNFLNSFAAEHNILTAHELRLAALLRLNMPNKEIAKLFNIEPDSVKKARNRLRKKLMLDSKEDLTAYIIRFSV